MWAGIVELQSEADRFDGRGELVQARSRERSGSIVLRGAISLYFVMDWLAVW
jgi:hypothetical protein